jgi:hypothetical protein
MCFEHAAITIATAHEQRAGMGMVAWCGASGLCSFLLLIPLLVF